MVEALAHRQVVGLAIRQEVSANRRDKEEHHRLVVRLAAQHLAKEDKEARHRLEVEEERSVKHLPRVHKEEHHRLEVEEERLVKRRVHKEEHHRLVFRPN